METLTNKQIEDWLEQARDDEPHVYVAWKAYLQGKADLAQQVMELLEESIKK